MDECRPLVQGAQHVARDLIRVPQPPARLARAIGVVTSLTVTSLLLSKLPVCGIGMRAGTLVVNYGLSDYQISPELTAKFHILMPIPLSGRSFPFHLNPSRHVPEATQVIALLLKPWKDM